MPLRRYARRVISGGNAVLGAVGGGRSALRRSTRDPTAALHSLSIRTITVRIEVIWHPRSHTPAAILARVPDRHRGTGRERIESGISKCRVAFRRYVTHRHRANPSFGDRCRLAWSYRFLRAGGRREALIVCVQRPNRCATCPASGGWREGGSTGPAVALPLNLVQLCLSLLYAFGAGEAGRPGRGEASTPIMSS
jgi:hypothetical protein